MCRVVTKHRSLADIQYEGELSSVVGAEVAVTVTWSETTESYDLENVEFEWDSFLLSWRVGGQAQQRLDLTDVLDDRQKALLLGWKSLRDFQDDLAEEIIYEWAEDGPVDDIGDVDWHTEWYDFDPDC